VPTLSPEAPVSTVTDPSLPAIPADGSIRLLLLEDDPGDAFLVRELLADTGLNVHITHAETLADARRMLTRSTQCVLADLSLPDADGLDLLQEVLALTDGTAVVVLTGLNDVHLGIRAVALGAEDYLVKGDVDGPLLARAIRYAIER
jgi:DNA-binding response OmpR family regulator